MILVLRENDNHVKKSLYRNTKKHQSAKCRRTSFRLAACKGSVTVEAAIVIPLFFLAVVALLYMMEVMSIRTSIRNGMQYAARHAAEDCYLVQMVSPTKLESDIVEAVGSERLERSIIVNGSSGISCGGSRMSMFTGILDMEVTYQVKLPIPIFASNPVNMKETMRMKGWNGYRDAFDIGDDEEIVYVTESGMVYHRDYHCNYLELSIRTVSKDSVGELRNDSQEKYHPCEKCVHGAAASQVYLTDYGNRYHNSLSCSGLKRTIYAIPISEAVGKGACTKCSK